MRPFADRGFLLLGPWDVENLRWIFLLLLMVIEAYYDGKMHHGLLNMGLKGLHTI